MSYLEEFSQSLKKAAHTVQQGWHQLVNSASNAITHFKQSPEQQKLNQGVPWGVLSCELVDEPEAISLTMEIPGVKEDDLEIEVNGQLLTVRGQRHYQRESRDKNFLLQERAFGSFSRQFMLPEKVNTDQAKATYKAGVLNVMIPKSNQKENVRRIVVSH